MSQSRSNHRMHAGHRKMSMILFSHHFLLFSLSRVRVCQKWKKKINLIFRRFSKRVFYIFIIPVTLLKCETTQRCGQTFFVLYSSTSRFCSWKIYTREPARDQSCAQDDCWSCDTSKHQWSCSPWETESFSNSLGEVKFDCGPEVVTPLSWVWQSNSHRSFALTSCRRRLWCKFVVTAVLYLQILTPNH